MKQTGIFEGRVQIPYPYGCFGYTRGGGKTWHGGIDLVGLDSDIIRMPFYKQADGTYKPISGTVTRSRIITDHSNLTWEWGYYTCVQLDANQTPDAVNFLYFCHNSKNMLQVGHKIKSGDALAIMGNTGNAALNDPPYKHCHFEVRATATGKGLDPTAYCGTLNTPGIYTVDTNESAGEKMPIKGIDVSRYQGVITWKKVAEDGIKFAILRAGSCNNSGPYVDPYFEANYKGAKENGIAVGAYFYTYATTETAQNAELEVWLPALAGKTFEYPVFVDVEDKSLTSLGRDALTALVKRMMDILDQKGFMPGWYSYTNYINNYLSPSALTDYPLWVADYRAALGYTGPHDIWQYTSSGSVNGIPGAVDMNLDYHGYADIKPEPEPEPQPEPQPVPKLQMMTVGPLDNALAMIIWGIANKLGLGYSSHYTDDSKQQQILTIGPASTGDAMTIWNKAKELDAEYHSEWVV